MKKSKLIVLSFLLLVNTGCDFNFTSSIISNINSNVSSSSYSSVSSSSTSISSSSSSIISSKTSTITSSISNNSEEKEEEKTIEIYAFNDFHGRISENRSANEPGISKLASYLDNQRKIKDEVVVINSGDYWQDTYESGYNKGKLLTECLDAMKVDAFTLGNHEFDWGIDVIKENKELSTYTPFLGCNIVNYYTNELVDFVEPYKIIEKGDIKIGIVGAIGRYQLTSITSSNWEDITFLDHTNIVKDLSDELRVEKDCDIVLLSIHADEEDTNPYEISKVSPVSNENYFDAVFCAHSHQNEIKTYNGVPFLQGGSHANYLSNVSISVLGDEVTNVSYENKPFSIVNSSDESLEINEIKEKYFTDEYYEKKDKVLGTITGDYVSSTICGRILAKATFDLLKDNNIDADIVINNGARSSGEAGEMTSEEIFNMIPFTNKTIVAKNILGSDIINECVRYTNPYYMKDPNLKIENNKYYTVACIDYMMLHKNTNRKYDYFKSFNKENVIYTIEDYCNVIVENYLLENKVVDYKDFLGSNYTCLK